MKTDDPDLLATVKTHLDDSIEHYDAATRSRLTQARFRALQAKPQRPWLRPAAVATLASTTAAMVIAIVLWQATPLQDTFIEDLEIIASNADLEFYQELEFYQWLDDEYAG